MDELSVCDPAVRNLTRQKLDSISGETDMTELCRSFFDAGASPTATVIDEAKLEDKVFMVLNWSMGLRNLGIHRPYGAYTMLRVWAELREEYLEHRHAAQRHSGHFASFVPDLFPILYKWLDTSAAAKKPRNVQAIGITFGEFTRQGLFSYSRYMQTLIAYGHTARARPNGPRSHHLDLLQAMPIFVEANDLLKQRRMALSGDSKEQRERDEREEQDAIAAFKEESREYVPELYGYSQSIPPLRATKLTGKKRMGVLQSIETRLTIKWPLQST
jgi:mediator of RNA polymerase II transcription subunit 12